MILFIIVYFTFYILQYSTGGSHRVFEVDGLLCFPIYSSLLAVLVSDPHSFHKGVIMTDKDIISADTTLEAARVQYDILRKMDISDRAEITFRLCDNMRAFVEAGIRDRHPDYDDNKVRLALMRLTLGERLFREAFGNVEIKT